MIRGRGPKYRRGLRLLGLVVGAIALVVANVGGAAASVGLGTADSFAVLAGAGVTNTGPTLVNGDLGTCPTPAITGFPPGVVNGTIHAADAVACQAQSDLTIAYNDAAGRAPTVVYTGPTDLGGMTLNAGVYSSPTSLAITGTLTLDAQGDPDAVFIFQAGSTLITAPNSRVVLVNGAQACNVFWQVGSSAVLGVGSTFIGTILALTSITANTNATVEGRLLARNGAVTLDSNVVTRPVCVPPTTTSSSTSTSSTSTSSTTSTTLPPTTTTSSTTSTTVGPTTTTSSTTSTSTTLPPTTTTSSTTSTSTTLAPTTTTSTIVQSTTTTSSTTSTSTTLAPTTTTSTIVQSTTTSSTTTSSTTSTIAGGGAGGGGTGTTSTTTAAPTGGAGGAGAGTAASDESFRAASSGGSLLARTGANLDQLALQAGVAMAAGIVAVAATRTRRRVRLAAFEQWLDRADFADLAEFARGVSRAPQPFRRRRPPAEG